MSRNTKNTRRFLTASMGLALAISLTSCSGATNNSGNIPDENYATAGQYSVTYEDLWNELKWSAADTIEDKKTDVVISEYTKKIASVMSRTFDDTAKKYFDSEDDFNEAYTTYATRLIDYVVEDIYNLEYSSEDSWDKFTSFSESTYLINETRYVDDVYTSNRLEKVGDMTVAELLTKAMEKHNEYNADTDDYLEYHDLYVQLAKALPDIYYVSYAKELFAYDKVLEDVIEEDGEDHENIDISEDEYGYYTQSNYVTKFKSLYTHKYDVSAVVIRFASEDEYSNTLRAFGLKYYNKELYYVKSKTTTMSYNEYCDYYDDIGNKELSTMTNITQNYGNAILELFVQMYNYIYGDYVTETGTKHLDSALTFDQSEYQLDNLRNITEKVISAYADNSEDAYNAECETLKSSCADFVTYDTEKTDDISTSFTTYLYDTLDEDNFQSRYSTSSQSYSDSYYIAFKFASGEKSDYEKEFEEANDGLEIKDATTDEISEFIFTRNDDDKLFNILRDALINDDLTETKINSEISDATSDVGVKIYNKYVEIGYSVNNDDYSKTIKKSSDSNLLATLSYDGSNYDLNIYATETVDDGDFYNYATGETYGVFNELEKEDGATTALDLLSQKMVYDTQAYKDTAKDRDIYENYIETVLYNFAYDSYSSNGYPASIGKYNFLMLYYHYSDIDDIIDNYYRVQTASTKLLTDYTNDDLISFFKSYTDNLYDNYFSISGTRLVVYYDLDDDGDADKLYFDDDGNLKTDGSNWSDHTVNFEGTTTTLEVVAKKLIYEMYTKILASSDEHVTKLTSLIEEYNDSARVSYESDPIANENYWAKYKKLGLSVMSEEFEITNSITDCDFCLKKRLYEYTLTGDERKYNFFIDDTVPSQFIEHMDATNVAAGDNTILATGDGFNLLIVTSATTKNSAKYEKNSDNEGLLENIYLMFNDKYIENPIENIYNDEDKLNLNQIKLYVIDYMNNGSSTLSPSTYEDAITSFLTPVVTRYTSDATQREILLAFIDYMANDSASANIYDAVTFNEKLGYNGAGNYFDKIIQINRNSADSYTQYYKDYSGTSNSYTNWWSDLQSKIKDFIVKNEEE